MKRITLPVFIVLTIFLLVFVGYITLLNRPPSAATTTTPQSPTPTINESIKNILQAGGSSYKDPTDVYGFLYPTDYAIDMQNNGKYTRLVKIGETQKGQTELYDGNIMVFESIELNGQSLTGWVDARIKENTADGTVELINPKTPFTVNGYPGFTYTTRGLGAATNVILQKDASSSHALSITTSVSDPQQKGYQDEVNAIIATIELFK
jgi:hypothetical protein